MTARGLFEIDIKGQPRLITTERSIRSNIESIMARATDDIQYDVRKFGGVSLIMKFQGSLKEFINTDLVNNRIRKNLGAYFFTWEFKLMFRYTESEG